MKPPFHAKQMQAVINDLRQRHGVQDRVEVTHDGQTLVVETIKPRVIRLAYFAQCEDGYPVLEREVLFFVDDKDRWIPYKTRYLMTRTYALRPHLNQRLMVLDPDNQMALAVYCENWAVALKDEWLSEPVTEEDEPTLWPEPTGEEPEEGTFVDWMDDEEGEATHER
jgi:hypothetical protein